MGDAIIPLVVFAVTVLVVIFVAFLVDELAALPNERRRIEERTRNAEREIADIGQWEQDAILAELRRRTKDRRPEDWSSPRPSVVDGEVLHIEDEPGGSRR